MRASADYHETHANSGSFQASEPRLHFGREATVWKSSQVSSEVVLALLPIPHFQLAGCAPVERPLREGIGERLTHQQVEVRQRSPAIAR